MEEKEIEFCMDCPQKETIDLKINGVKDLVQQLDNTVNLKLDNYHLKMDNYQKETKLMLEKILEQTTKTNGRVSKLESEVKDIQSKHLVEEGINTEKQREEDIKIKKNTLDIIFENKKILILLIVFFVLVVKLVPKDQVFDFIMNIFK